MSVSIVVDQVIDQPQRNWRRREWRLFVGLALSVLCLYLALRGISLTAIKEALSIASWGWVLLATVTLVLTLSLKAFRWRLFFLPQQIRFSKAWSVYMIGQMLNATFPARAGDIGRIYLIGGDHQVSRGTALSTVILEKIVDLVMLSLAYLVVAVWLTITSVGVPEWLRDTGKVLIPLTGLGLIGLLLFTFLGRRVWHVLRKGLTSFPPHWRMSLDTAADKAIIALESFRHGRAIPPIWGWSLVIWGLMTLTSALLFPAFHLELSPFVALLLTVVLMSGVAVPPLPGTLGVFTYLCQLVLTLFGVNRETALVYGITLQAIVYLPQIVLGVICLFWENWAARRSSADSPRV